MKKNYTYDAIADFADSYLNQYGTPKNNYSEQFCCNFANSVASHFVARDQSNHAFALAYKVMNDILFEIRNDHTHDMQSTYYAMHESAGLPD